jgi:hypothetical protein
MQSPVETAHLCPQCRFRLRTMTFNFSSCCFIDHLHCCFVPLTPSHTLTHPSSIYANRAHCEPPCCHLIPGIYTARTHTSIQPHIHPRRRSFQFRFISAHSVLFFACSHSYSCPNPPIFHSRCTLAGRFLLAVSYICLVHFLPGDEV